MNIDQFNWLDGLDTAGWIAAALFTLFFIIAAVMIVMMLKMNAENKKDQEKKTLKKSLKKSQVAASKPARPAPVKTKTKSPEKKDDDTDPLEQAEVYITYGLHKQAVDLLKEYLEKNPSDKTAIELLAKAQAGIQQ